MNYDDLPKEGPRLVCLTEPESDYSDSVRVAYGQTASMSSIRDCIEHIPGKALNISSVSSQ